MSDQNSANQTGVAAPPADAGQPKVRRRWLLPASLALNLLVAGVIGGAAVRHSFGDDGPMMVRDLAFGPFTEALSPEDHDALRRSFMAQAGNLRDLRPGGRADFDGLVAALRAAPFDLEAVKTQMATHRDRMAERLGLGQDLLVERIAAMSDGDRAAFAGRLEAALRHRPGGGKGD